VLLGAALSGTAAAQGSAPAAAIPAEPRFTIQRFEVAGASRVPQRTLQAALARLTGENKRFSDIEAALEAVREAYEREIGAAASEWRSRFVRSGGFRRLLDALVAPREAASGPPEAAAEAEEAMSCALSQLARIVSTFLTPALAILRKSHPAARLKLHDMSPREQIAALRSGELDVALIGQEGAVAAKEFHSAKLCSLDVCAALADSDRLASKKTIALKDLKGRDFIGIDEQEMPGRNRWMTALCKRAGFKPRFINTVDGITNVLSSVVSESATTLLPAYFAKSSYPGVTFHPISDAKGQWDFLILWQKGRASAATRALMDALNQMVVSR
jgi:DNA-binding transcriptional LysR family regulator